MRFFKISKTANATDDTQKKFQRQKTRRSFPVTPALIGVIVVLIVALAATVHELGQRDGIVTKSGTTAAGQAFGNDDWVSAERIQEVADAFGLSTEVLSRLFPDKIVYKGSDATIYAELDPQLTRNHYDWKKNLTWKDGRPSYTAEDGTRARLGVDVSHHQKKIDWKRVAADGIEFAMIRVGYRGADQGTIQPDEYAEKNIKGAAAAGIPIGAYFFSQATSDAEAVKEAEYLINALSGAAVTMPVVYDIEDMGGEASRTDGLTPEQITSFAKAFCDRVAKAGYTPMIYANTRWFMSRMNLPDLENYQKWLAQYYEHPMFPYEFSMWQYTESGKVDGMEGDTDMNLYFPG